MQINTYTIMLSFFSAMLSGIGTALIVNIRESKKEKNRKIEREQDHLKMEIKDLKIQLFQIEKELSDWKDKYYNAIQQLIEVKAELENTLIQLSHVEIHSEDPPIP